MKKRFSLLAMLTVAIAGFLTLTMASPSFAASQANKAGVSFGVTGQYLGLGAYSINQAQVFDNTHTASNTFQVFLQRVRLNSSIEYDKLADGMPLAAIFTQIDLTNDYNGTTSGYGSNGYETLGYSPVPTGFNNDFNTFGLRQAYIRVITPVGAVMFGRMPVKFGLGIAANTNADGLGDFLPFGNVGLFLGVLFGNESASYSNGTTNTVVSLTPPATYGYSHIQMGTVPTIELMSLKPVDNTSWALWYTEAHLNQFGGTLSGTASGTGYYTANTTLSANSASANISFGGLYANYSKNGTKLAGEFDYFRGDIENSPYSGYYSSGYLIADSGASNARSAINSYDLYATGSKMLDTSTPMSLGFKFGIGGPISESHLDMTYYSMVQNTRTLFGDVLGNQWQPLETTAYGETYMFFASGEAMGPNLANRYGIMVDAKQYLPSNNTVQESLIHEAWLKTSIDNTSVFGGSDIGTEFDLNLAHHFTKTLQWQAWGAYVWTGSGVDSPASSGSTPAAPVWGDHKDVLALGTAVIWNF